MTKRATGPHHTKEIKKERGGWLSAALILIIIRNSVVAIWIFTLGKNDAASTGTIMTILLVLVALTDVISGLGMWKWKKWGLYLFGISTVAGIALHTVVLGPLAAFHDIIGPAILAYILSMQNKYRFFE
jgi:membrane protein YdbS with pleckstrin-like domain